MADLYDLLQSYILKKYDDDFNIDEFIRQVPESEQDEFRCLLEDADFNEAALEQEIAREAALITDEEALQGAMRLLNRVEKIFEAEVAQSKIQPCPGTQKISIKEGPNISANIQQAVAAVKEKITPYLRRPLWCIPKLNGSLDLATCGQDKDYHVFNNSRCGQTWRLESEVSLKRDRDNNGFLVIKWKVDRYFKEGWAITFYYRDSVSQSEMTKRIRIGTAQSGNKVFTHETLGFDPLRTSFQYIFHEDGPSKE